MKVETLRELWLFVRKRKLWWLGLVVLVLAAVGLLLIAIPAPVAPFVYTLF